MVYCENDSSSYHGFVWFFVWCGSAPFCVFSPFSLLAKRKSGREICESSLLPCFFSLCWFFYNFFSFVKPNKVFSYFLHTFLPLLSLSGPCLGARSAATEE